MAEHTHDDRIVSLDRALVKLDGVKHWNCNADLIDKLQFVSKTIKVCLMIRTYKGSRTFLSWRCRYDDTRGLTNDVHPESTADEFEI